MQLIVWLITVGVLALQPDFCFTVDRRNFDGEKYTELCGGLYQKTRTWTCIEVPGHHRGWK